jgi:hypothetical protein
VKTARPFWLTRAAVVALALSFFAACDDTTEPEFQLDPENTADIVDDLVTTFFTGNDAANSLMYFGDYIGMALGGGILAAPSASPPAEVAGGIPSHVLRDLAYSAATATIPATGITFVWDDVEGVYVASERAGAPVNGMRFILYAVNPITEEPLTPVTDNEIGYLDITDDSSWPSIDITLEAVINDVTLIYAAVTGNFGELSAWLDLDGYFSDGTNQLSYNLGAGYNATSEYFDFSLEYGNFEASWEMTYTEAGLTVAVTFSDGTNTLVCSMTLVQDTITDGGITFNGDTVAIIEGYISENGLNVTITNAEGDPLTPAELAALGDVFDGMGWLYEFMDGMFMFAAQLANLAQPIN